MFSAPCTPPHQKNQMETSRSSPQRLQISPMPLVSLNSQNVQIMQPLNRNQQQILPSFQQNNIQQIPFIQAIP